MPDPAILSVLPNLRPERYITVVVLKGTRYDVEGLPENGGVGGQTLPPYTCDEEIILVL